MVQAQEHGVSLEHCRRGPMVNPSNESSTQVLYPPSLGCLCYSGWCSNADLALSAIAYGHDLGQRETKQQKELQQQLVEHAKATGIKQSVSLVCTAFAACLEHCWPLMQPPSWELESALRSDILGVLC